MWIFIQNKFFCSPTWTQRMQRCYILYICCRYCCCLWLIAHDIRNHCIIVKSVIIFEFWCKLLVYGLCFLKLSNLLLYIFCSHENTNKLTTFYSAAFCWSNASWKTLWDYFSNHYRLARTCSAFGRKNIRTHYTSKLFHFIASGQGLYFGHPTLWHTSE